MKTKIEMLKERLEQVMAAEKTAFEEALKSGDEKLVEKANSFGKMVEEIEAQIEALETKQEPPQRTAATLDLTEKQKWAKGFAEAVTTGANFSGGMPQEMATDVIKKVGQFANLVSLCDVRKLVSDLSITVETGKPTVSYVTEGSAIGESDPKTSSVVLSPKKLACIGLVSNEVIKDVSFDIVAYITETIASAIADKLDHEILLGTGTSSIEGIIGKSGITKLTTATTLVVTWAEVKKLLTALKGYKAGCTLVMSQEIADQIHDFKDGSGNYIFPQNEELTVVKGHPVKISDQMPDVAKGNALIVAGNFKYYVLGERDAVEVTILDQLYQNKDQVGVKVVTRVDGKVGQAEAFAALLSA